MKKASQSYYQKKVLLIALISDYICNEVSVFIYISGSFFIKEPLLIIILIKEVKSYPRS